MKFIYPLASTKKVMLKSEQQKWNLFARYGRSSMFVRMEPGCKLNFGDVPYISLFGFKRFSNA